MKVAALLMDTRSIQKYIFSGTTLRTNIFLYRPRIHKINRLLLS